MYNILQGHFFNFLYFLELDQTLRPDTYTIRLYLSKESCRLDVMPTQGPLITDGRNCCKWT